ncbi:MAG: Signal recognition particle GTPase [uncultured Acidilobus sp. MG]|nr:MAG: Signal recognition particle GTPase [uncultured Acidilobus sp. MG]
MVLEGVREAVRKFLGGGRSYEESVNEFIRDLQRELIRADVNVALVKQLTDKVRERALKQEPPPGVSRRDWFLKAVYDELVSLFGGEGEPRVMPRKLPWVILLVGVQGSGKTTTAGKLARYYSSRGLRVGLVSADTYRPGALEQLKTLAQQAGVMFYGEQSGQAEEIAKRGVSELLSKGAQLVIVDTAGRHGYGDEVGLLEEMKRVAEAVRPDEVMLVIDAAIGQRAYDIARRFHEATPVGSIVVTKLDGTARGGGVLSAVAATGARVKFVGTGEKIEELEPFNPQGFVARVMGLGDIRALLERVREAEAEERAVKVVEEDIAKGRVTMRTIYAQLKSIRRLGPLSKLLEMLPTASLPVKVGDEQVKLGEEKIRKWLHIIESMTYEELDDPEIIDRSRMRRIALGSGTTVADVKELLTYYRSVKAMLKRFRRDRSLLRRLGLTEE